jgi:hypothetical protein
MLLYPEVPPLQTELESSLKMVWCYLKIRMMDKVQINGHKPCVVPVSNNFTLNLI